MPFVSPHTHGLDLLWNTHQKNELNLEVQVEKFLSCFSKAKGIALQTAYSSYEGNPSSTPVRGMVVVSSSASILWYRCHFHLTITERYPI